MQISWPNDDAAAAAMNDMVHPPGDEADMCVFERLVRIINRNGGWISKWDSGWEGVLRGRVPEKVLN